MRSSIFLAVLLVLALLIEACTSEATPTPTPTPAPKHLLIYEFSDLTSGQLAEVASAFTNHLSSLGSTEARVRSLNGHSLYIEATSVLDANTIEALARHLESVVRAMSPPSSLINTEEASIGPALVSDFMDTDSSSILLVYDARPVDDRDFMPTARDIKALQDTMHLRLEALSIAGIVGLLGRSQILVEIDPQADLDTVTRLLGQWGRT